jgi:hypothetical protein
MSTGTILRSSFPCAGSQHAYSLYRWLSWIHRCSAKFEASILGSAGAVAATCSRVSARLNSGSAPAVVLPQLTPQRAALIREGLESTRCFLAHVSGASSRIASATSSLVAPVGSLALRVARQCTPIGRSLAPFWLRPTLYAGGVVLTAAADSAALARGIVYVR